jgi:hypothetical protein
MIYALFLVCLLIFAQKGFNHFRRYYLRRNTSLESQHLNQDEELQKFDQAGDVALSLNFDWLMTYRSRDSTMCISKRPCFAWGVPECRDKLKAVAREARQFAACSEQI